ncbi:MBL fold metallo-hydrolase [Parvibaculum sp.]|uniref:MBL fold metallo-hydrolase n=1 Tax=Parvibaculum sp. TaxID=2024848 RepID=UPI00391DC575
MAKLKYALAGGTILVLAIVAAVFNPTANVWLFRQASLQAAGWKDTELAKPNELSLLVCGSGSPLPDPTRAGPCALVAAGDRYFLIDAGLGSMRNLRMWRVPLEKIEGVFITHFHSDHIAELGEVRLQTWISGRKSHLPVYGPTGIQQVVDGFENAYALDTSYRTAHHGEALLSPDVAPLLAVEIGETGSEAVLPQGGGLRVKPILVEHHPVDPAFGFRFNFMDRSVTISGDTARSDHLAEAAKNTDILLHEALSPELVGMLEKATEVSNRPRVAKVMSDIPDYHTSPVAAAEIANEANARLLVLTHLVPVLPNGIAERAFFYGVSDIRDDVHLARDGDLFVMPEGTDTIRHRELD